MQLGNQPIDSRVANIVAVAADANGGIPPVPNYKNAVSLEEHLSQEEMRASHYVDGLFDLTDIQFKAHDEYHLVAVSREYERFKGGRFVSSIAESQIAGRLGFPAKWFAKSTAALKLRIMEEHGGEQFSKPAFLRISHHGELRAILGPAYAKADNADLLGATLALMKSGFNGAAAYINIDEKYLNARILFPTTERIINDKRIIAGVQLRNSEVGLAALGWDAVYFVVSCWNGIIYPQRKTSGNIEHVIASGDDGAKQPAFHHRHVGRVSQRIFGELEKALGEIVESSRVNMKSIETSAIAPVDAEYFDRAAIQYRFPNGLVETVKGIMNAPKPTAWDYIDAVTAAVQGYGLEQRLAIEKSAGRMLDAARN